MGKIVALGAFLFATSITAAAGAGDSLEYSVQVYSTSAYGGVDAARYSGDSTQYIGCYYDGGSGTPYGGCQARDSSGNYKSCWTTDPSITQVMAAINHTTLLTFEFNSSGQCTFIEADNESMYLHQGE